MIMNKIKIIIKDIVFTFLILVFKLVKHIPKNPEIWVFGSWNGELYADNSKYMFEYVNAHHPEIQAVWITKSRDIVEKLRKKGYLVYKNTSFKGMCYCVKASVAFITEATHDISEVMIAGAKIIQLWHGMGIKDVRSFIAQNQSKAKSNYIKVMRSHSDEYWMTACEEAIKKYSISYNIPREKMYITGQPKDDTFVSECNNAFIEQLRKEHPDDKIIVYLPTHRNFGQHKNDNILSYDTLMQVNVMLAERHILMIFKPHAHEFKNYQNFVTDMSNIVFATDVALFGDVYEFLPACDGLITDYSGIMLGYLTCEKPIIYFAYDKEDYIKDDAGFYYKYDEITAGPVCSTWKEVIDETTEIFVNDRYADLRTEMRLKFSPFNDGKNKERVYEQVKKLLKF